MCGNHTLNWVRKDNLKVKECSLCGHLEGHPEAVEKLQSAEEALERGVGVQVYCLIKAIENFPGFKVVDAVNGDLEKLVPPSVTFTVLGDHNDLLERFMTSLGLATQKTKTIWDLRVVKQSKVAYLCSPRLGRYPEELTEEDIRAAFSDLFLLAESFERDARLYFWTKV